MLRISLALVSLLVPGLAFAQDGTTANAGIVSTCEVAPDYFQGNCPAAVTTQFVSVPPSSAQEVADLVVALGERLLQAEAEGNVGLCIDLAAGIQAAAGYAFDDEQRTQIEGIVQSSCCIQPANADFGLRFGAAQQLALSGTLQDGSVTAATPSFEAASANFSGDGVSNGDFLVISSGSQQGLYLIDAAQGPTALTVGQATWPATEAPLEYAVLRVAQGAETCEPGATTAALPPEVPVVDASP